jgi:dihydroflavonol-4-reductase
VRALVTGANGLVGANLVRELLAEGVTVTALVRPTADISQIEALPIILAAGDVLDPASLEPAIFGQDVVFHAAVAFSYWGHDPALMKRTAIEGSRNVLAVAAAAGVPRVVMTSSSVVLGASRAPQARDEDASAAEDPDEPAYVLAKIDQEHEALRTAERLEIEVVFACPTMSVGPYGATLGPSNAVVTSYLADPMRLTWAGGCNIVSVRDVARGHVLLARDGRSGARYVLGSENLAWPDIHRLIAELAGVPPPRATASATACHAIALAEEARARVTGKAPLATRAQARLVGRFYWYGHARAAALGYAPRPAREALADALAWLSPGAHVSRETRTGMRLAREVYQARAAILAEERRLASAGAAA